MKMTDWVKHLEGILTSSGEQLLQNAGKVSHQQAINKAKSEYIKYQQKTLSEVEKTFLDTIKTIEKNVKSKVKTKRNK